MEKTYQEYPLSCRPGCNLCCTQRIYATSIEAYYILDVISEDVIKDLKKIEGYPRPKITNNQTILCYMHGTEPPQEEPFKNLKPCVFLDEKGLCKIYERRPLMCRVMASVVPCNQGTAELPPFLFQISTIAMQLAENIDIGGVYGNLFDLLKFLYYYKKGKAEEVPDHLLNNLDVDELPILPEEKELRKWVGTLYRTPVEENLTFRNLLTKLREDFQNYESLSFLKGIF